MRALTARAEINNHLSLCLHILGVEFCFNVLPITGRDQNGIPLIIVMQMQGNGIKAIAVRIGRLTKRDACILHHDFLIRHGLTVPIADIPFYDKPMVDFVFALGQ